MTSLRSRILASFLFALLTLGQGYPFAVAWGMSKASHPCCCSSEIAKPCDCDHDLLNRRKSEESGLAGSERGGMGVARREPPLKKRKFSCHSEPRTAGISPAPCGAKTEIPSLNFRGEACLPRYAALILTSIETLDLDDLSESLPKVSAVPDPPPPKRG